MLQDPLQSYNNNNQWIFFRILVLMEIIVANNPTMVGNNLNMVCSNLRIEYPA